MGNLNRCCRLIVLAAIVITAIGVHAADAPPATTSPAPDLSAFTDSYHVPFAKPVDFDHLKGMSIRASLNGGPVTTFLVDTGSVGIIVAADEVPNIDPHAPAGSMVYSSSGIELDGVWTPVTVTFPDSKDADGRVATAVVPVLAATERKVTPGAVNSGNIKPTKNPKVYMFGVGFGRGKDPHPERNPFVNLNEMQAGKMRRGYTIARDGFTLGLTAKNAEGYQFQQLKERTVTDETKSMKPGLRDWESSRGSVTVDGKPQPDAAILIDTGLTNMMIGVPGLANSSDVEPGTAVAMHLLGDRFSYEFKVGDETNPQTPRRVTWIKPANGPTLNTGLRALAGFDYLFDADGGWLGLRAVPRK